MSFPIYSIEFIFTLSGIMYNTETNTSTNHEECSYTKH